MALIIKASYWECVRWALVILSSSCVWNKTSRSLLLVSGLLACLSRKCFLRRSLADVTWSMLLKPFAVSPHRVFPASGLVPRHNPRSTPPMSLHKHYSTIFKKSFENCIPFMFLSYSTPPPTPSGSSPTSLPIWFHSHGWYCLIYAKAS